MAIDCKEFEKQRWGRLIIYWLSKHHAVLFHYLVHAVAIREMRICNDVAEYTKLIIAFDFHRFRVRSRSQCARLQRTEKREHSRGRERTNWEMNISNMCINENRLRRWNNINPILKVSLLNLFSFFSIVLLTLVSLSIRWLTLEIWLLHLFAFTSSFIEGERGKKIIYRSLSRLWLLPRCSFLSKMPCAHDVLYCGPVRYDFSCMCLFNYAVFVGCVRAAAKC